MAIKPPPLGDMLGQFSALGGAGGSFKQEAEKNLKALAQSALEKLDVVSREEFDAQTAVLKSAQAQVTELEEQIQQLTDQIAALENS